MLQQIQRDFKVNRGEMIFIGDSLRDYEASKAMGCEFVLVKTGNGMEAIAQLQNQAIKIFDDLLAVARYFNAQS